jgi:hypothetical protein
MFSILPLKILFVDLDFFILFFVLASAPSIRIYFRISWHVNFTWKIYNCCKITKLKGQGSSLFILSQFVLHETLQHCLDSFLVPPIHFFFLSLSCKLFQFGPWKFSYFCWTRFFSFSLDFGFTLARGVKNYFGIS